MQKRKKGERGSFEIAWTHKDGSNISTYVSGVPIYDDEGRFIGGIAVTTDISRLKSAEEDLKRANAELLAEHYQRKILSERLIDILEQDRQEIAMDLHDHIGQLLTSLKINLEVIDELLEPENKELKFYVNIAAEKAVHSIRDIKRIAHGLKPGTLDKLGLVPSLHNLFKEIEAQVKIQINFFARGMAKRFDSKKELTLYRISQEALNNIVKHSKAEKVFVNLVLKDQTISLSIEDNGIGFNPEKTMKSAMGKQAMGLLIMQARSLQNRGEFTIESKAGKGTLLLVEMPI